MAPRDSSWERVASGSLDQWCRPSVCASLRQAMEPHRMTNASRVVCRCLELPWAVSGVLGCD
jgi:hypothetical protein